MIFQTGNASVLQNGKFDIIMILFNRMPKLAVMFCIRAGQVGLRHHDKSFMQRLVITSQLFVLSEFAPEIAGARPPHPVDENRLLLFAHAASNPMLRFSAPEIQPPPRTRSP